MLVRFCICVVVCIGVYLFGLQGFGCLRCASGLDKRCFVACLDGGISLAWWVIAVYYVCLHRFSLCV